MDGKVIVLVSPPSEYEENAIVVRNEVYFTCSVIDHVTLTFDLETCRHVARGPRGEGQGNLPTNFGVSIGRFVFDLSANTCQTRHVTLRPSPLTLEVTALVADTGRRAPSVYQV